MSKPMKKLTMSLLLAVLLIAAVAGIITHLNAQNEPGAVAAVAVAASGGVSPALLSEATVTRSGKVAGLEAPGEARVFLNPKETVAVHLGLNVTGGVVRVSAPNGGTFNQKGGALSADGAKLGGGMDFQFTPGATPGRYTVEVNAGNDTQTLEFWVGDEPPQGKPGPALVFRGN
jgi:hypothetical protein